MRHGRIDTMKALATILQALVLIPIWGLLRGVDYLLSDEQKKTPSKGMQGVNDKERTKLEEIRRN